MNFQTLDNYRPQVLSILRVIVGLVFLQHGLQKWFGFPVANPAFANIQLMSMLGVAGVIELTCGSLIALGLFTRYAAFIASGEMAAAYWISHFPRGAMPIVNAGSLAMLYCFVFFYLVFAGPGPWSVDAAMGRDGKSR